MAFRILNNYEADVGLTNLFMNRTKLSQLEQQLSTGLRIVRAADDATDLFIADYLKHTYVGLQRGTQNAQYGLAAARIVDDALGRIYDILVKIKDKLVEAANAHTDDERIQAQQQINEYVRNIAQIVAQTEYDGRYLLAGDQFEVHFGSHKDQYLIINAHNSNGKGVALKAQAGSTASGVAKLAFVFATHSTLGSISVSNIASQIKGIDILGGGDYTLNLGNISVVSIKAIASGTESQVLEAIEDSIEAVESLMTAIDKLRGYYAGIENKLQNIIENNQVMIDNMKEGESLVRNIDYASAMAEFQKLRVVTQANVAALAQANQIPQLVLQLLR